MKRRILGALAVALAAACTQRIIIREIVFVENGKPAQGGDRVPPPPPRERLDDASAVPVAGIDAVLEQARAHLGQTSVRVNGVSFRYDCSGFVRGLFSVLSVDLMSLGADYPNENGVGLIYRYVERHGENHRRRTPVVGELVYFDNTWDKNGNGLVDDTLTHVGVVEEVQPDGTFVVIHRANRGIVRDFMNLERAGDRTDASGRELNGLLRPKSRRDPPGTPRLMGELFAGFGHLNGAKPGVARDLVFPDFPAAAESEWSAYADPRGDKALALAW